ncbi:MAG: response regulator [Verrucomicrobia bacterium]|nr:response regulator [Verrucomicrobiota bacterium]
MQRDVAPILIADDDADDAEALKGIIREAGISNPLRITATGQGTIEYLSGQGEFEDRARYPYPAFLFLDLIMPGESGMDVLRWIRQHPEPEHRLLGIVVVTGLGNFAQIRDAYRLGAHSFLAKPVSKEAFMNLVYGLKGIHVDLAAGGRQLHFDLD